MVEVKKRSVFSLLAPHHKSGRYLTANAPIDQTNGGPSISHCYFLYTTGMVREEQVSQSPFPPFSLIRNSVEVAPLLLPLLLFFLSVGGWFLGGGGGGGKFVFFAFPLLLPPPSFLFVGLWGAGRRRRRLTNGGGRVGLLN